MKPTSKGHIKTFSRRAKFLCFFMIFLFSTDVLFAQTDGAAAISSRATQGPWALVIHGGAGGPVRGTMSPDKEKAYLDKLNEALQLGSGILAAGGCSLDAVEAVVRFMEDCPLFNAGKGAVLNENGKAELDASIMDGMTGMAGAVAGVTTIKNPVTAARRVMEKTSHVMLIGAGAEKFARAQKLEIVDPSYFITPERLEAWKKNKAAQLSQPTQSGKPSGTQPAKDKPGTVGAVALDCRGSLAAATSTGGMMGKMTGRIGDSPIIGAGTYANNNTCAISCTGHGEYFLRAVVAYDISCLMEYKGLSLQEACEKVVNDKLVKFGGEGGLIAADAKGNICLPFNSEGMYRGYAKDDEEVVASYG